MANSETQEKTRYWLKLEKDFLKSPHIKVIKAMPNGKDYVLFYLALMLESIDSVGHLKFTDLIPYDDAMLSSLTDTNIDVVRSAVNIFTQLGLIEKLEDGTIFIEKVAEMTGRRCESADRVAKHRAKKNLEMLHVTKCNDNKEEEKQEEKKKKKDKDKQKHRYGEYQHVLLSDDEKERFISEFGNDCFLGCVKILDEYCEMNGKSYKNYNLAMRKWVVERYNEDVKRKELGSNNANSNSGFNYGRNESMSQSNYGDKSGGARQ